MCQNWIRPFTEKHRFIAQLDSACSNTSFHAQLQDPDAWARVSGIEFPKMSSSCMLLFDIDLGPIMYLAWPWNWKLGWLQQISKLCYLYRLFTFFALINFLYFRAWNYQTYITFRIKPRNKIVKDTDRSTDYQIFWAKYGPWLKNRFLFNKIQRITCFSFLWQYIFLSKER